MTPPLPGPLRPPAAVPFVGREAEILLLAELWAEAADTGRRVALIGGEPGAGKTRLARELARDVAERGATVLYGACDPAVSMPYQPFVEALEHLVEHAEAAGVAGVLASRGAALARLLPDVPGAAPSPPGGDGDTERHRLFNAVGDVLRAAGRVTPAVLVLDDLQWADGPTLLLLGHLARTGGDAALLLIAAYREDELVRGSLAELHRAEAVTRLSVGGLSIAEIGRLVDRLGAPAGAEPAEVARALHDLTGGNPFLVGELWRELAEHGAGPGGTLADVRAPQSVRDVVDQRLGRLAPATRELLEVAAVLGRTVELGILRTAAKGDPAALPGAIEEAISTGMLEEVEEPRIAYRFRHELLRRAVADRLGAVRRAALHARAGEALEAAYGADPDRAVADLAFHFAAAAPLTGPERAVAYAVRAADAAMRGLAFDDAAQRLRTALDLGVPGPRERAAVLRRLGLALHRAGHSEDALAPLRESADLAAEAGDVEQLAQAAIAYQDACWRLGHGDRGAVDLLDRAATLVGEHDAPLRTRVLSSLSQALAFAGRHEAASARWQEAVALARRSGDRYALAVALQHGLWARGSRPAAQVLAAAGEALRLADELGDVELRGEAGVLRIRLLIELYQLDAARRDLAAERTVAERAGQPFLLHIADLLGCTIAVCDGDLDEAEELAERALEQSRELGRDASAVYGIQMFTIRREQGRLPEVGPVARLLAAERGRAELWGPALAVLFAEVGMIDDARAEIERLSIDGFAAVPAGGLRLGALSYLADAACAVDDPLLAALVYAELLPYAGFNVIIGESVACYGAADRFLGALAAATGDWRAAKGHFDDALRLNGKLGARTWIAHTQAAYGGLLVQRDDEAERRRGVALLADAHAAACESGLVALARRAGAALPPEAAAAPDGLSSREVDVLRLVARGMSNRDIGRALYISEHTVANHIRSILMKTGCANRTEAASYAHEHGLVAP